MEANGGVYDIMEKMIDFALIECSRIDWSKYEVIQGRADSVPLALEALLTSPIKEAENIIGELKIMLSFKGGCLALPNRRFRCSLPRF